ncbi:unnamed protein product [Sphagnum balticum]
MVLMLLSFKNQAAFVPVNNPGTQAWIVNNWVEERKGDTHQRFYWDESPAWNHYSRDLERQIIRETQERSDDIFNTLVALTQYTQIVTTATDQHYIVTSKKDDMYMTQGTFVGDSAKKKILAQKGIVVTDYGIAFAQGFKEDFIRRVHEYLADAPGSTIL